MKLSYDESVESFRREFIEWLAANRPTAQEMAAEPSKSTGHRPGWARAFTRRMFDDGWLVPGWPAERGGRNAGPIETLAYLEVLANSDVPRTTNPQGLGIVVPSLLDYGTPEQIERYALPLLRGELTACLGMSEPDAGSDLAGLKTRAVRDGDRFVVNGQKVWTSGANHADLCYLFCRTDIEVPKHKGISILLVPMETPGITVRPLNEIVHPEWPDLNEVFFDDVEVPVENLVGRLNNGWAMANGSLAHERGMVWLDGVMATERAMRRLLELAPAALVGRGAAESTLVANDIVSVYAETHAARCLGYRGFARLVKGGDAPEQALMKLFASSTHQRLTRVAADVCGPAALLAGSRRHGVGSLDEYFNTFRGTISAGSSEIQRNIIAEKILGLPRG